MSKGQVVDSPRGDGIRRVVALGLSALVIALTLFHLYFALAVAPGRVPAYLQSTGVVPGTIAILGFALVGALITSRQPRNRIGWLMIAIALAATFEFGLAFDYAALGFYVAPRSVPGPEIPLWIGQGGVLAIVVFGLFLVVLPLLFPDGHLARPWLRVVLWLFGLSLVILLPGLADSTASDPFSTLQKDFHLRPPIAVKALSGYSNRTLGIAQLLFFPASLLACGSLVLRYRRAGQEQRHQIKWLLAAVTLMALMFILSGLFGSRNLPLLPIAAAMIPVAVGIAILKYRLYDIDVVISRTLVYGALAALITAVYVGIVVGIGDLIGSGGQPNLALSIVATAIVAVAFQPVRERLQKIANRLVYGKRATPYEVLSEFSERVAESYAANDVLPRMARVLAEGTGAAQAEVWLRSGAVLRQAALWPEGSEPAEPSRMVGDALPQMVGADRAVEVRHQGELLGALTVSKRKGESLTPVEEKLLTDLAGQAGLVLKNVGLTAELLARLEDLRASRQRLVAAQDEERRRLERNLHDGSQQNLVALKVKLGLAEIFVEKDPARAKATLAELKVDTDEALETLRDLARGIYPPLLADQGLVAALESQARKATLPVEVDADGVGRYPQEVEAAVYFCCLEALQNVQKYSAAQNAVVRLDGSESGLTFEVTDDGQGFDGASVKRGAGLTNMTDRIDALGGSLEIFSTPQGGTRVRGYLPALVAVVPA